MRLIRAFLTIVRWPNLIFIALTQGLFYTCIYLPLYDAPDVFRLLLLMAASVSIAAAGYIINDYFDINIDRVNKPDKNVVDRVIHRRFAIILHLFLSVSGVVLTFLAVGFSYWYLIAANGIAVLLLWFYSTSFKKQFLIGNVIISLLTSWTILVLFFAFTHPSDAYRATDENSVKLFRLAFLYAAFAFIISLIREAIKDMEDLEGDIKYGCKTLPVVSGVKATRLYVSVWTVVLIAVVVVLQLYILQFGWWMLCFYSLLLIVWPLVVLMKRLRTAESSEQFHRLSNLSKLIMLSGILSMVFFQFYF